MQVTQVSLSSDRKVTQCCRRQTHKDSPAVSNTYGLPAGDSCPDKTPFCESCYADSAAKYPTVHSLLWRNFDAHLAAGDDVDAHYALLDSAYQKYRQQFDRLLKAGRVTVDDDIFRLLWSGDLYSDAFTAAWVRLIGNNIQTQFWVYTRSFDRAPQFHGLTNVAVYLSVDSDNLDWAAIVLATHSWLHAAFCADTQADAAALAAELGRTAAPCPENIGRIPLVMHQSGRRTQTVAIGEDGKGACAVCRLCVDGVRDVAFAIKGR